MSSCIIIFCPHPSLPSLSLPLPPSSLPSPSLFPSLSLPPPFPLPPSPLPPSSLPSPSLPPSLPSPSPSLPLSLPPTVVPPVFSVPPSSPYPDVLALQGTSVTIPCMASGFPPPTFSWVRVLGNDNKQQVLLGERHSIPAAGTGNGSLTISPAEIADTSTYSCVAQNSESLPAVESEIVFLRVIGQSEIICGNKILLFYSFGLAESSKRETSF